MSVILPAASTSSPLGSSTPTPTPARGRWRGFLSGAREIDDAALQVQGRLPDWLRGGLLLNGPALWDLPRGSYRHWFDGLAMLHRIEFAPEAAPRYRSRFARSQDYLESIAAGAPAYSAFDTRDPETLLQRLRHFGKPRSTDNPAVVMSRVGAQWIATTESPHLLAFDPLSLASEGRLEFDDGLGIQIMGAHGITDAEGNYWNVGITLGPKCIYKLFRLRPGGHRRELVGSVRVAKAGYTHAFAMTPGHALIWETALRAQPLGFLFTGRSYIENFRWDPAHGSVLHAVSLADGSVRSWDIPPMLAFHPVQAYQDGADLVAELCCFDDAGIIDALQLTRLRAGEPLGQMPRLRRYRLRQGHGEALVEDFGGGLDLPQVHPERFGRARAGICWGSGLDAAGASRFFDRTLRLDLERREQRSWQRPDAIQLEPLFVPRPGGTEEDDGVLLVPTLADADDTTRIGVVDAHSMECLALVQAPQVIPFGFHAAWAG
ncbi:carotenoid oxygenase family protein [Roseateles violae]|uniref:Carotenoid oxygenase family protein n=1 Tax=Roseateles violae TaxID=3058042 RepID=A0ABT8DK27_9BURK|nr:carotenoid oxygenase family protein [Pelomonas sp. PFR6]MDN3918774.1 carotenoid oxygenase family protein [Pelomonas sp. PFR6]